MNEELATIKISDDLIKTIVSKQIQQAIVKSLGNAEEYMEALVANALHRKVDYSGKVSNYNSDNKFDFLDVLLKKEIGESAQEAIREYIAENKEKLKSALKKEMKKPKFTEQILNAFASGAADALDNIYSFHIQCDLSEPK